MYDIAITNDETASGDKPSAGIDIEAEIDNEVQSLRSLKKKALFQPVRIDIQCGKAESSIEKTPL